jgi:hypothetical protein
MEYVFLIFSVQIKVWNYVLGRRWKIYKDSQATKKGYLTNYWSKLSVNHVGLYLGNFKNTDLIVYFRDGTFFKKVPRECETQLRNTWT